MIAPRHTNRTADEIVTQRIHYNAKGFGHRAASWLDLVRRTGNFAALHYACIDARLAIEHLIFEEIQITAGDTFIEEKYESCLNNPTKLHKLLKKYVPDYEKLQTFTEIVASFYPEIPRTNKWNLNSLMRSLGHLSSCLHLNRAQHETIEKLDSQKLAIEKIARVIDSLWNKMCLGQSACIRPDSMPSLVHNVWKDFLDENIDRESARRRLEILQPLLRSRRLLV